MLRESVCKLGQRRVYVRSQSNRTERRLRDGLRGCHKARRGPRHLHAPWCRGGLDQGHERPDRGRQRDGLQGEHGGHLRPRRLLETEPTGFAPAQGPGPFRHREIIATAFVYCGRPWEAEHTCVLTGVVYRGGDTPRLPDTELNDTGEHEPYAA